MRRSRTASRGACRALVSGACAGLCLSIACLASAAPEADLSYHERPPTWKCMLIDKDHKGIYDDKDFATWVKAAQDALAAKDPPRSVKPIFTFTQCFSGGFLGALFDKGVSDFTANSACRYYEGASYDVEHVRSYYSWAWGRYLDDLRLDDFAITQGAADALQTGMPRDITANPRWSFERPQYFIGGVPAKVGGNADGNYAILFAGVPDELDMSDYEQMYGELLFHGLAPENIMVLFGNQELVGGKKATKANLEWAWKTWLVEKVCAQGADHLTAQVFFWAGDHGNADTPIAMSVKAGALGQAGTDVRNLPNEGARVFEAGSQSNKWAWKHPTNKDIDAIAFADDFEGGGSQIPLNVYFSVDEPSVGESHSGVYREGIVDGRGVGGDVFIQTHNSNRQMIDSERTLGLDEAAPADELDALALRNILAISVDVPNSDPPKKKLTRPMFFSVRGSSLVQVYDPRYDETYTYVNFALFDWDGDGNAGPAPSELDGLALSDDCMRVEMPAPWDPRIMVDLLVFDLTQDDMLFSIGRDEADAFWKMYEPCDVIRAHFDGLIILAKYRTCESLGLLPTIPPDGDPPRGGQDPDNIDGLDVILVTTDGTDGPKTFKGSDGDLDDDGDTDPADLALLLAAWGPCAITCQCPPDLDGDGVVGAADLGLLLSKWSG